MKSIGIILIIDPYSHIHLYINNILSVYLTNQILQTSFTFLTIYTHVTNTPYFLILKLYKVILHL